MVAVFSCRGLVWIQRLPYRISAAGQGGGGPISEQEMDEALLLSSDQPVLAKGCVCHTDGAKAYRNLAAPLYDGSLLAYEHLKLGHTSVKHKPPHPEFTKRIETRVWQGDEFQNEIRWGGTQKLDGFFAGFRRCVGKKPFNTAGDSLRAAARMEKLMHRQVRLFQFKYWFHGHDPLLIFGKMRQVEREADGALTWASLENFKLTSREPANGQCHEDAGSASAQSELFFDDN